MSLSQLPSLSFSRDGAVRRYKARLVAKGFPQRPGVDFEETFSPVVKHDSLRAVLAIAAERDLNMLQLDVKTAFLNGDLIGDLYMTQPTGFIVSGREGEVCKLNRSIYGLKQASRAWNIKFHGFLIKSSFIRSSAQPCVYVMKETDCLTIIAIWVDDGLICGSDIKRLGRLFMPSPVPGWILLGQSARWLNSLYVPLERTGKP